MSVRKQSSGKWLVEVYPEGRPSKARPKVPRVRKQFATKGEALNFERWVLSETESKPWEGSKLDRRRLSELVDLWQQLHGRNLAKSQARFAKLKIIVAGMGDPVAADITAKDWAHYRQRRIAGLIHNGYNTNKLAVKPSTINQEQAFLKAVFNELTRLGEWNGGNPLNGIRVLPLHESEVRFLESDEIDRLLQATVEYGNPDLQLIVELCLATGARWREAEGLTRSQVIPYKVTYQRTKGRKNRTVPISPALYERLPKRTGPIFTPCYHEFWNLIELAKIELPEGQGTHVLRHTFASHFMMNGGNILVLQRILGHANIKDTMKYAHFSPDHFDSAVELNPLQRR
ncbi:tyrosine-type recombinase/integrase [Oceanimonas sp. AH20CE76]|uniref:phage integrase n=1 Tax=Oceanimonas sp. AH20CE76 TaxID=2977120 RepID=UPI0031FEA7DD